MASNKSAFLDGENKPLRVGDSAMPKPGSNDVIVRVYAVGVNTIDPAQQAGFLIKQYPTVLGHDLAGEVYEVGSSVTRFKKGDRIIGHAQQFLTGQPDDGAFSHYARVRAGLAAILPDRYDYKQGAVLPLAIDTAACGFYKEGYMQMEWPSFDAKPKEQAVIIYGGSSSVGIAAIQLAINAGYKAIATASPKNHDLCREAGASDVFDYKSPTIADDIAKAVGTDKFIGLYNAIGIAETYDVVKPIMGKLGGGFVASTKPPTPALGLPDSIVAKHVLGVGDFSSLLWENWVGKALEDGKLKCLPEPKVVGKGLESLQKAFAIRDGDVNAAKIVVEL